MKIKIVVGSNTAIFRQIAEQISRAVATGEIAVGHPVPSVRVLAKELLLNPNTVVKAYGDLVRDGVLETQPGRGYFVAKRRQIYTRTERLRRLDEAIQSLIGQALALDFSIEEVLDRTKEAFGKAVTNV
ncbi:MAG: GntR family transcriptional regulator [Pirellula sp.]